MAIGAEAALEEYSEKSIARRLRVDAERVRRVGQIADKLARRAHDEQ